MHCVKDQTKRINFNPENADSCVDILNLVYDMVYIVQDNFVHIPNRLTAAVAIDISSVMRNEDFDNGLLRRSSAEELGLPGINVVFHWQN